MFLVDGGCNSCGDQLLMQDAYVLLVQQVDGDDEVVCEQSCDVMVSHVTCMRHPYPDNNSTHKRIQSKFLYSSMTHHSLNLLNYHFLQCAVITR